MSASLATYHHLPSYHDHQHTCIQNIQSMNLAFKDLNERLLDITAKCDIFSLQIRQDRIPEYLTPNNYFLGQYLIADIISYSKIEDEKVYRQQASVF